MVPDWLIGRLTASDMQRLADEYRGLAGYLANRAKIEAQSEAITERRRAAGRIRRDHLAERNRLIMALYRKGRSDAEIGKAVHLTARTVQRVIRDLLTPIGCERPQRARKRPPETIPAAVEPTIAMPESVTAISDAA